MCWNITSNIRKRTVLVAQSCLVLCDPWTVVRQAPLPMEFSRQEYWRGLPFPSPGDLPNPGIKPRSPALQADSLPFEPAGKPNSRKAPTFLKGNQYIGIDHTGDASWLLWLFIQVYEDFSTVSRVFSHRYSSSSLRFSSVFLSLDFQIFQSSQVGKRAWEARSATKSPNSPARPWLYLWMGSLDKLQNC